MFTATLQGLVDRFNPMGERLGRGGGGAVMKHARDFNLVRVSRSLSTTLSRDTDLSTFSKPAAPGWKPPCWWPTRSPWATSDAASPVAWTPSDAPIGLNEKLRKILLEASRARPCPQRLQALAKVRPQMLLQPALPATVSHAPVCPWASTAKQMAAEWDIAEDQDALALASHQNPARAYEEGFFNDLMTSQRRVQGQQPACRPDHREARSLKPCFDKKVRPEQGTLTPATPPLTDGASAVLLASGEWAAEHWPAVLAYLTFSEVARGLLRPEEGPAHLPWPTPCRACWSRGPPCRTSTSTKSTKPLPRRVLVYPQGLGRQGFLQGTSLAWPKPWARSTAANST